jgi:glycosyltransferase involved in cell wall biosynthesis
MISRKLTVGDQAVEAEMAEPLQSGGQSCAPHARDAAQRVINVHVHLAVDKDVLAWRRKRESGDLVGINDVTPYGYGRAEAMGCRVTFSTSKQENKLGKLFRLGVRGVLGADLVHAWRNRAAILKSDIVWTHTESQYLSVALVGLLSGRRVRIVGQTIWLMDAWDSLFFPHKFLFRWLVSRVDVLTFHSQENLTRAKALFPSSNARFVKFGIPAERWQVPRERPGAVIRILAPGNDRHRDWGTLVDAVSGMPNVRLKVLSGSIPGKFARNRENIEIAPARHNDELREALDEATIVCVPLRENLHASGITVIQEAVLSGVPVVATGTGGLSAYFSADEIRYVPPGDANALRAAFEEIFRDPRQALDRARRAQARMLDAGDMGAQAYIRRHVELSREILKES